LQFAGAVLRDQTQQIVEHWRSKIIASIPHLARHSRAPDGSPLPDYLAASNRRFQQWILDTCLRPLPIHKYNNLRQGEKKVSSQNALSGAFIPAPSLNRPRNPGLLDPRWF